MNELGSVSSLPESSVVEVEPLRVRLRAAVESLTATDRAAVIAVVLLLVLFAPPLLFDGWTPRAAVLAAIIPVGSFVLLRLVGRRDPAALALGAVLLSALVSCLLSGEIRMTVLGAVGRDMSMFLLLGTAAAWALGRSVSERGRSAVEVALVSTACVSALVGVLQVLLQIEVGSMALYNGRPTGFTTNPVYFAAIVAAGLASAVARPWRVRAASLAAIALLALATAWSDSRVAFAAAILVLVAFAATHRNRPSLTRAGVAGLMIVIGVLSDRLIGSGSDSVDRILNDSGDGRTSVWRYGMSAWAERPLFGFGPGRFRAAVQGRFDASFVRVNAADDLSQPWFDAHNVAVNLLVSVGVVTTLLIVVWVVLWARSARGPLVWFLVVLAMTWSLQPVSIFTLPLAGLVFGVTGAGRSLAAAPVRIARPVGIIVTSAGALLGLWLLVADVALRRATDAGDADGAARAAALYLGDPVVADIVAQVYSFAGEGTVTDDELTWRRRAVEAEPDRPYFWSLLALAQLDGDDVPGAMDSVERALDLQPYNIRTLSVAAPVYIDARDEASLTDVLDRMCELELVDCALTAAEVIARVEAGEG